METLCEGLKRTLEAPGRSASFRSCVRSLPNFTIGQRHAARFHVPSEATDPLSPVSPHEVLFLCNRLCLVAVV
jgi:hypothetical protein